ncbi:MAG: hypothetical protein ACOH5I_24615 [Oligoflexus sp.]
MDRTSIKIPNINLLLLSLIIGSCQHSQENNRLPINPHTIINENITALSPPNETLLVPTEILKIAATSRPTVEVREGPGVQFPLLDQILVTNTLVVLINQHKIWTKVYIPDRQTEGWVHQQTYQSMQNPPIFLELPLERLPLVSTRRRLRQIFDYQSKKPLSFSAPKGHVFRCLAKQGNMFLIYLPETRSIAWIKAGDVI